MRGPSTLAEGERELIATVVSYRNECRFCSTAHAATTNLIFGEHDTVQKVKEDIETAPVSEKMKALLNIASQVQTSGKKVNAHSIKRAKNSGATDVEIHDTVLIAALFCLYNRYVDGLSTVAPEDGNYYETLAKRLVDNGYERSPEAYENLKKQHPTKTH